MPFQVKDVDRRFFDRYLADMLPAQIVDVHTHIWLKTFFRPAAAANRGTKWPNQVADENPIEDLMETYRLMFPGRQVTPVVFGSPRVDVILEETNGYVSQVARSHHLPSLLVSTPAWTASEVAHRVADGGFLGLKPYLSFAPSYLSAHDITVFDFLPRSHLEVAHERGWIVVLHIPRPGRLGDPVNLEQILEIERRYPNVRLIVAHIGRVYCPEDAGDAFSVLRETDRALLDFSANTNAHVMEQLIRAVGPKRILFGSDLPILRMRMRRICENGHYVNLVPPGLYGAIDDDPHMREVSPEEGATLSFFMYEQLLAFRRAAEATGLGAADLLDVFWKNAASLLRAAGGTLGAAG